MLRDNRFTPRASAFILLIALVSVEMLFAGKMPFAGKMTVVAAQKATAVERYQSLEVILPLTTGAKNPYNPEQVDIQVTLVSPGGLTRRIPAFYAVPYRNECTANCAAETLKPDGSPGWRFRYTPDEAGEWKYSVEVKESGTARTLPGAQFTVIDSKRPGFIGVAPNKRYFQYADGSAYFPIGANVGWSWSGGGGTLAYVRWLQELKRSGANYGRLYVDVPWFLSLETKPPIGDYTNGQPDAWRLDTILTAAEEQGVALQIVLYWGQALGNYSYPPLATPTTPLRPDTRIDWAQNVFNIANNGPIANPALFFSNELARKYLRRRLRYIMARWSHSPAIFAWELIDQIDRTNANNGAISDWFAEMAGLIRELDSGHHPITAGMRDLSKLSLLDPGKPDFVITRAYQRRPLDTATDQIDFIVNTIRPLLNETRPVLLTEFSINPWFEPTADDPQGVHVIQSAWAAALSGAAGGAMSNWWDTYLFPQNIIAGLAPLRAFSTGIPWQNAALLPADVQFTSADAANYRPLKISAFNPNYAAKKAADVTYQVTQSGIQPPIEGASAYLYAQKSVYHQEQRYRVNLPTDTTLTITTKRMPADRLAARLQVTIDGKLGAQLFIGPRAEPLVLALPIAAGEHLIVMDNIGDDALQLDSIAFGAFVAPLRAVALSDTKSGVFAAYIQHRDYTWERAAKKREAAPVTFNLSVPGLPAGRYRVELWEPATGNAIGEDVGVVKAGGALVIALPPINRTLAVRAFRVG